MSEKNKLYFGDNLDVLRRHVADASVDLVYLDPPFNSNANYNVLFKERDGAEAASQIQAFEDTWRWDQNAAWAYQECVEMGGKLSQALQAFRNLVGESDMLAYLSMMAPRLQELRRVLKPTGSIYLHCDPTASHYLKLLMDAVFGPEGFLNEVIWKRTFAHGSARRYGPVHDTLLFYARSARYLWTGANLPHDPKYIKKHFRHLDETANKCFQPISLTGAGVRHGESGAPWRGIDPTEKGRHWALPSSILQKTGCAGGSVQDRLDALDKAGRIYWPKKKDGVPRLKWYVEDTTGAAPSDVITDVPPISAQAQERLGYPTQKPLALLERIIQASSNEGDVVLDPFCGCGTTIDAAQKLGRRWIGIDVTHLAINLIRHRLQDTYGEEIKDTYEVIGEPTSVYDARVLAEADPYQFQWWALGLVGARPAEGKKGADKGIDGRLYFHYETGGKTRQAILSVKAGKTTVSHVRDLRGVVEREGAELGVLISMHPPTKPMRTEAAAAGFFESPWGQHPKIQLLTVSELLEGKRIDMPQVTGANVTYKKARKRDPENGDQMLLREDGESYG